MSSVSINLSTDQLAEELSRWSYEDLMELLKTVDEKKSEWDFIVEIKKWADVEHRKMAAEELEDKALREEKCQVSAQYPDLRFHVDPHRGCVLR